MDFSRNHTEVLLRLRRITKKHFLIIFLFRDVPFSSVVNSLNLISLKSLSGEPVEPRVRPAMTKSAANLDYPIMTQFAKRDFEGWIGIQGRLK
jgi:hypothetical protein